MTDDNLFEAEYRTKKGRTLKGKQFEVFEQFWRTFRLPKGKAEAADAWYDLKVTPNMLKKILSAATREAQDRPEQIKQGHTPKMAQGWLSGRRFEDEATNSASNQQPAKDDDAVHKFRELEKEKQENPEAFASREEIKNLFRGIGG